MGLQVDVKTPPECCPAPPPSPDATRWEILFEQSAQSMQVFGPDGWTRRVNSAWQRLFRLSWEQAAQFNILTDPQLQAAGISDQVRAAFAGDVVHVPPIPYVLERPGEKEVRWVGSLLLPILGTDGALLEVVCLHEDLTERRAAEQQLRENQQLLESITRSVAEAIYRSTPSGQLTFVNEAYLQLFGYDSLIELNAFPRERLYARPGDRARLLELLSREGGFRNEEVEFRRRDGSTFWGLISSRGHRDPDTGAIAWFDGVITDVSDRRDAEQRIRELNATLEERVRQRTLELANTNQQLEREVAERLRSEATLRAVWQISEAVHASVDLDQLYGRIHAIVGGLMPARNFYLALYEAGTQLVSFPYYTDERSPAPEPRRFSDGLTEYVIRHRRPLLVTQDDAMELARCGEHTPHGPPAAVWLGIPLTVDGEVIGVMTVQDYNDPRAYGVEQQQILTFVAEQIALAIQRKQASGELVHALERERELGQVRKNFVSIVSHEFRTPLGIIASSAGLLEKHFDRLDAAERSEQLTSIRANVRRMSQLMEEVLLFGRVEEGRLECERRPLDPAALCRIIVDEQRSATDHRCPIQLSLGALPAQVQADERLLRPVLGNLIANAVKYSDPGSPVEVRAELDEGALALLVRDRGCGIPAGDLPKLFEPFRRGSNVSHVPGTGLGLTIVRRCVRLHGGVLDLSSAPGQGTTVKVRLPVGGTVPSTNPDPPSP